MENVSLDSRAQYGHERRSEVRGSPPLEHSWVREEKGWMGQGPSMDTNAEAKSGGAPRWTKHGVAEEMKDAMDGARGQYEHERRSEVKGSPSLEHTGCGRGKGG